MARTTLKYSAGIQVGEYHAAPRDQLTAALQKIVSKAKEETGGRWEVTTVSSSSSSSSSSSPRGDSGSTELPGWRQPGRLVGAQPLQVLLQPVHSRAPSSIQDLLAQILAGQSSQQQQLSSQQQQLAGQQQQLAALARPRVSNGASSIILLALSRQSLSTTSCDWDSKPEAAQALSYLEQATGAGIGILEPLLNGAVTRRNNLHHPGTLEVLDQEVQDLKLLLPGLRPQLKDEAFVLDHYEAFRALIISQVSTWLEDVLDPSLVGHSLSSNA